MSMKLISTIFIICVIVVGVTSALPTDEGPLEITVKEKWTKVIDGVGMYQFSDTNGNVYSIQDTWWHMDFSAANRYASIEEGEAYEMWFFGVRFPFFSMFQNAYRIEEIPVEFPPGPFVAKVGFI